MNDPKNPLPAVPPTVDPRDQWSDVTGGESIKHLTSSNFDEWMATADSVLVMFYAPCKFDNVRFNDMIFQASSWFKVC